MALGDGIRRNIASVEPAERALLKDAFVKLMGRKYPGFRDDPVPGGVTWWFKQDEIHAATHVHGGPEFLPWHRELVNRFEGLLQAINPELSLHYWDWNTDPVDLFTPDFMGSARGDAGDPWLDAGFYDPDADPFRADDAFDPNNHPFDPPRTLRRDKWRGAPPIGSEGWHSDSEILAAADFREMNRLLTDTHDLIHFYIGGTIEDAHTSFRDPFVFLLHSNVDRLFAFWQLQVGHEERLDPQLVYGPDSGNPGLNGFIEPWSTGRSVDPFGVVHFTRPWFAPENEGFPKTYKDVSVVAPPHYAPSSTVPTQVPTGQEWLTPILHVMMR